MLNVDVCISLLCSSSLFATLSSYMYMLYLLNLGLFCDEPTQAYPDNEAKNKEKQRYKYKYMYMYVHMSFSGLDLAIGLCICAVYV